MTSDSQCNLRVAIDGPGRQDADMRVLLIGGTRFVGRHVAQAALDRGDQLTLFNRGLTNPSLFPEAEHVRGDRHTDLGAVAGREFDVIVDSSAYFPADVEAVGRLADTAAHYVLVSSLSVYPDPVAAGTDEQAQVIELEPPFPDEITSAETYGGLKVLCERTAHRLFAGRALIARAGVVVGPHDYSGRFAYWPRRMAAGGRVLAAEPEQPLQFIDARDLADWLLDASERRLAGTFNAAGPASALTMKELLANCSRVTGGEADVVWAGDEFLLDHGVEPFEDLPLWLPREFAGFCQTDSSAALAEGLSFRPLVETIADTFEWDSSQPTEEQIDPLPRGRERELLAALEN